MISRNLPHSLCILHSALSISRRIGLLCALALLPATAVEAQFGTVQVNSTSTAQSVTVTITKTGTVSQIKVLTGGTASLDFASGSGSTTCATGSVTKGNTCTKSVTFTPSAPGARMGAVVLLDSTGAALGTGYVYGTGRDGLGVLVPGNVITVAGQYKKAGYGGDGAAATLALLKQPSAVVMDGAGNLYITDTANNRIRKVTASTGYISTIAGKGDQGYTGDGAAATSATLSLPTGLALDGAGNLFVADSGNNAIRKIAMATTAATPLITTVAGTGTYGYSGDSAAATSAKLSNPMGVTVASNGDLYIADTFNQRIRKVTALTGIITTVAGNGTASGTGDGKGTYSGDSGLATAAGLSLPYAVAFDTSGNMFIPDWQNSRIRKVNTSGYISTFAGTGTAGYGGDGAAATSAQISLPAGVLADPAGNVYIADSFNGAIRKVNATTGYIETVILDKTNKVLSTANVLGTAQVYEPIGMFQDGAGNVYYADYYYMQIEKIEASVSVLDFTSKSIQVKDKSAAQQQKIENDGNYALDLSKFTPGANSAVDTATTTCTLNAALDEDTSCKLGVVFAPSTSLSFNGATSLSVIDQVEADGFTDGISSNTEDFPLEINVVGTATPVNATTTTLTSSNNPSTYGQAVTFTVTVTSGSGAGTPTGKVTITDTFGGSTTTLATGLTLASGTTSYSTSALAVGTHEITASYTHTGKFLDSTSDALEQIVGEVTTTKIVSSANPSLLGASVTFTATVKATSGSVTPVGTVTWSIDGTTVQSAAALSSAAQSTYTTSVLALGNHTVKAVYSGDSSAGILTSTGTLTQDVQTSSTTTLSPSVNPSSYGQTVTFTATVAGNGTIVPTGTVRFLDDGTQIGTGTLNTSGVTTYSSSSLAAGTHPITAVYKGDTDYKTSTSNTVQQVVNKTTTETAVAAAPNPGIAGKAVAITATVKITDGSAAITGTVSFAITGTSSQTLSATLSGGTATVSPILAPGTYSIVASYSGDTNDNSSASTAYALTVVQATTSTKLTSSANPSTVGDAVTFTATVTGNGGTPSGAVNFIEGATTLGSGNLSASGVATFSTSTLSAATHSIKAVYLGDTNDAGSTSAVLDQVVGKLATMTGLVESSTTTKPVQAFLIATVVDKTTSTSIPTGTVVFYNATTAAAIGTTTLDENGVTTLTPELASGTYSIYGVYSGDAKHLSSQSSPIKYTTTAAGFSLTVNPTSVTVKAGENNTVTVEVSSTESFTDTIGLGCGSLPSGVNCHFTSGDLKLTANGTTATTLTIDTSNPLGGGGTASLNRTRTGGLELAGLFAPLGLGFGLVFWRFRRRYARALTLALLLAVGVATLAVTGCSGFTQKYATPGTYTIQVVGVGTNTNTTHYADVKLTITAK